MKPIIKALSHLLITLFVLIVLFMIIGLQGDKLLYEQVLLNAGVVGLLVFAAQFARLAYLIIKTIVNKCRGK